MFFRRSNRWDLRRTAVFSLAKLQIGLAVSLGPADAVLDIERFGSPVHLESPDNADCVLDHGHTFCQVVRSLSKAGMSGGIALPRVSAPPLRLPEPDPAAGRPPAAPVLLGSFFPRAPPIA